MGNYKTLFTPFKIGKIEIKNRFIVSPMGGISNLFNAKGGITEEGIEFYTKFAKGGFGLITTGSLATDMIVDTNKMVDRLLPTGHRSNFISSCTELTDRVHAYGAKIFAQLSFGTGRNSMFKSPSPTPAFFNPNFVAGELTKEEIKIKIDQIAEAAVRCKIAGFDGVDIHSIHWGYLLDQFALALTNTRTDEYGGSLENRMRVMQEILDAIREKCGPAFPVTIRVGLKTYITGIGTRYGYSSLDGENEVGRTLEEGIEICKILEAQGYDGLSCDVGQYESFYHACPPMYTPKAFYLPLAEAARKEVSIPMFLAGRMQDFQKLEESIAAGKLDAACFGRQALADPDFPKKLAMGREDDIRPCLACNHCIGSGFSHGGTIGCAVNPAVCRGVSYGLDKSRHPKKVVVVGGGVAGMEAALVADECGHDVTLLEKTGRFGGNIIAAGNHDFKDDVRQLNKWFVKQLADRKIDARLNTEATVELIQELGADVVINAAGSTVFMPKIEGIEHTKTVSCMDVLEDNAPVGQKVVIVGGGLTGVELALHYGKENRDVSIVEALPDIMSSGPVVPIMQDMMVRDLIKKYAIKLYTGYGISAVTDEGAVITNMADKSETKTLEADTVIMAIGFRPRKSMEQELLAQGIESYTIGDENRVGSIKTAIWGAYEVARNL